MLMTSPTTHKVRYPPEPVTSTQLLLKIATSGVGVRVAVGVGVRVGVDVAVAVGVDVGCCPLLT